jgi:hypothetical protein
VSQQLILPVAGLVTDPGPFTAAPEGSLVEAQNVVVLRPGVVEPRPGSTWFADSTLLGTNVEIWEMFVGQEDLTFIWCNEIGSPTWVLRDFINAVNVTNGPTSYTYGKMRTEPTGGRVLFTSNDGVCSLPAQPASPLYGNSISTYHAGMPQPYAPTFGVFAAPVGYPAGANWLTAGSSTAYRVTLRRRLANGSLIESAPSGRIVVTNNTGGSIGVTMNDALGTGVYLAWRADFTPGTGWNELIEGDELCIYRAPMITGTPLDEMRLRAVLTYDTTYNGFTTIVNGVATPWFDGLADGAWAGEALYTNATQEGAGAANYRPEYSRDIALFENMTFYAGAKTSQRCDITLRKLGTTATVTDPQNAICSFAFAGDIATGTNTILNCTNIRFFSIGQVITDTGTAPGNAGVWPANTYVTDINVATLTVTVSANSTATGVAQGHVGWDWIETNDGTTATRIYHYAAVGALPTRYFNTTAASLDNRWNGDIATFIQLRCTSITQTEEIVVSLFQPKCTDVAFTVATSKPLAWDRYVGSGLLPSDPLTQSEVVGNDATLRWSKLGEPEHCPVPYRTVVGDATAAIRRIIAARSSLLIFKDDGVFQCFGSTPDDLSFTLLDRTVLLPAMSQVQSDGFQPDMPSKMVARLDDRVFAMTNRGPMAVTDMGAEMVGNAILTTLRNDSQGMFGASSLDRRSIAVDPSTSRVLFSYDWSGNTKVSYVLDANTGTWTTWTTRLPLSAACARPDTSGTLTGFGFAPSTFMVAGRYGVGAFWYQRSASAFGLGYDSDRWLGKTAAITSVTGSGPYTVDIVANAIWTPEVGDLIADMNNDLHCVTAVASATQFTTDTQPVIGSGPWYEGQEIRVIWIGNPEGNVGAEKQWFSAVFPMEYETWTQRLKAYIAGYRNTSAPHEPWLNANHSTPTAFVYTRVPAFHRNAQFGGFTKDWALKLGFTIKQAGTSFATAGMSLLFATSSPDKVSR